MAGREKWHIVVTDETATETGCMRYGFEAPPGRALRAAPPANGTLCAGCTASKYARGTV